MATGKLAQHCFLFNVLIIFSCYICLKFKLPQGSRERRLVDVYPNKKKCQVTKFPQNKNTLENTSIFLPTEWHDETKYFT